MNNCWVVKISENLKLKSLFNGSDDGKSLRTAYPFFALSVFYLFAFLYDREEEISRSEALSQLVTKLSSLLEMR